MVGLYTKNHILYKLKYGKIINEVSTLLSLNDDDQYLLSEETIDAIYNGAHDNDEFFLCLAHAILWECPLVKIFHMKKILKIYEYINSNVEQLTDEDVSFNTYSTILEKYIPAKIIKGW